MPLLSLLFIVRGLMRVVVMMMMLIMMRTAGLWIMSCLEIRSITLVSPSCIATPFSRHLYRCHSPWNIHISLVYLLIDGLGLQVAISHGGAIKVLLVFRKRRLLLDFGRIRDSHKFVYGSELLGISLKKVVRKQWGTGSIESYLLYSFSSASGTLGSSVLRTIFSTIHPSFSRYTEDSCLLSFSTTVASVKVAARVGGITRTVNGLILCANCLESLHSFIHSSVTTS